jgi:hypothetical protein
MSGGSDLPILPGAMTESPATRLTPIAGLCALALAAVLIWVLPGSAEAVVGPNGQISGCYKEKGKAKGTLRVVPAGKRCKKGEKRLAWNAHGPQGQTGGQGGPAPPAARARTGSRARSPTCGARSRS